MQKKKLLNDEKILISVVVPAFNEEKNITSCLKALKKQNFSKQNYEIIVVNNASTDKTGEIADKIGVKVVFEPQKGLTFALKKGFDSSRGQMIAVTDADTIVPPDWLEKMADTFQKNSSLVSLSGRISFQPKNFLILVAELTMNVFSLLSHSGFGCNFAFKKEIYHKIGLSENHLSWETDFSTRAKSYGQTAFLWGNPVLTSSRHYRGREGFKYACRAALNGLSITFFKKTIFNSFSDIRE